ncbi:hypothetical protein LV457_01545 [Mycobacterium sp. MYCO198283]|uniref:hypothetical protein n=1 Tax=Mycobacterium sp. MYCO198283 TaxID=2883505 RepID=UPI001E62FB64|nr:hypothetical protein [Mycobacterium sp. MYCO198283]MCG5430981.1 hypothetical protein [Mycobacterium sp. MYCO198283]
MTQDWLAERAELLTTRLSVRGIAADVTQTRRLVARRVMDTARARRISSLEATQFVTDAVIEQMAEWFAAERDELDIAEHHVGGKDGAALVTVNAIGRLTATIAEVLLCAADEAHAVNGMPDIHPLAHLLHSLAECMSEPTEGDHVAVPVSVLTSIAREIDVAAASGAVTSDAAASWRREAIRCRGAAI